MLNRLKKEFRGEMFRGSFILLVLLNLFNIFNFLYQVISARLLGAEEYGILGVLLGFVYIFTIPSESIQTVVSKYTVQFGKDGKIKDLFAKSMRKFSFYGTICFIVFALISPLLSYYLGIQLGLMILTGLVLLCFFILPVGRGVLQGKKRFKEMGMTFALEGVVKVIAILALFWLGVSGSIIAIILALLLSFLLAVYYVRDILKKKREDVKIERFRAYSIPVLISISCLTAFFSLDVIFVSLFFSLKEVGFYAAVSMMGKLAYFGTSPISRALFPLAAERHEKNKNSGDLLKRSLVYTLLAAVALIAIYFLIPNFLMGVIYGSEFLPAAGLIGYSAIAFSLLALAQMFVYYFISLNKNANYVLIPAVAVQIVLIFLLHATLFQYTLAIILGNAIVFMLLFFYGLKQRVAKKH